jgi:hypothetical protein
LVLRDKPLQEKGPTPCDCRYDEKNRIATPKRVWRIPLFAGAGTCRIDNAESLSVQTEGREATMNAMMDRGAGLWCGTPSA